MADYEARSTRIPEFYLGIINDVVSKTREFLINHKGVENSEANRKTQVLEQIWKEILIESKALDPLPARPPKKTPVKKESAEIPPPVCNVNIKTGQVEAVISQPKSHSETKEETEKDDEAKVAIDKTKGVEKVQKSEPSGNTVLGIKRKPEPIADDDKDRAKKLKKVPEEDAEDEFEVDGFSSDEEEEKKNDEEDENLDDILGDDEEVTFRKQDTKNMITCTFDKEPTFSSKKWAHKGSFKNVIMNLRGRDYVIDELSGEFIIE